MGNLKNVNLQVANFSMECVNNAINNKYIYNKEYKTLVKKMSTLIQKNGFINTLAFNLSKNDKKHHVEVLKSIIVWISKDYKLTKISEKLKIQDVYFNEDDKGNHSIIVDLLKNLTKVNGADSINKDVLTTSEYRLLTKEMMILFGWMKRFADGMIEGD